MRQKGVHHWRYGHVADVDFVVEHELQEYVERTLENRGRDRCSHSLKASGSPGSVGAPGGNYLVYPYDVRPWR
jgi:hypothetical protein